MIPYGRQNIDAGDIREVVKVLRSSWLTQGPKVEEFERGLARVAGARYAVAVSSGTAALHIACLAAGLKRGDEAVTSPITFLSTANVVVFCGARPVFADIEEDSANISLDDLARKITKRTKAVLPVHFAGQPCDMPGIARLARRHGLTVIEDAAHAIGSRYRAGSRWVKVGSCVHSDMTVFSFHPVKTMTTAEGGAVTTNDPKLYAKLRALRTHGMHKDSGTAQEGPWVYEMRELGFNYRITDLQCALGLSQLKKLGAFIRRRREIVRMYNRAFAGLPLAQGMPERKEWDAAYHLYVLRLDFKGLGVDRKHFVEGLQKRGVGSQVHYIPVYRQPFYRALLRTDRRRFPNAEEYYARCLSLPLYPAMSDKDVGTVIRAVKDMAGKGRGR